MPIYPNAKKTANPWISVEDAQIGCIYETPNGNHLLCVNTALIVSHNISKKGWLKLNHGRRSDVEIKPLHFPESQQVRLVTDQSYTITNDDHG